MVERNEWLALHIQRTTLSKRKNKHSNFFYGGKCPAFDMSCSSDKSSGSI